MAKLSFLMTKLTHRVVNNAWKCGNKIIRGENDFKEKVIFYKARAIEYLKAILICTYIETDYAQIPSIGNLMVIVEHRWTVRLQCSVDSTKTNFVPP